MTIQEEIEDAIKDAVMGDALRTGLDGGNLEAMKIIERKLKINALESRIRPWRENFEYRYRKGLTTYKSIEEMLFGYAQAIVEYFGRKTDMAAA